MKLTTDTPRDLDPKVLKRLCGIAWGIHVRRDPRLKRARHDVRRIVERRTGQPWWDTSRSTLWINPSFTQGEHVLHFVHALLGRRANAEEVDRITHELEGAASAKLPARPAKVRAKRQPPTQLARLTDAEAEVERWEALTAETEAELRSAKKLLRSRRKKLRAAKASVAGLRRAITKAPHEPSIGDNDFVTAMRLKRERGEIRDALIH